MSRNVERKTAQSLEIMYASSVVSHVHGYSWKAASYSTHMVMLSRKYASSHMGKLRFVERRNALCAQRWRLLPISTPHSIQFRERERERDRKSTEGTRAA